MFQVNKIHSKYLSLEDYVHYKKNKKKLYKLEKLGKKMIWTLAELYRTNFLVEF